ncbi:EF-Tu/IF-2/RF-3 family GTPase [Picrophilus oshimae]|uniref:Protein translation elongation factor n=1 Tax=Picrophilus torridus (strain ATCC 700027 / DSM 9790 / JCM 10055 / NBRC 100828 / KAW 2/3) TaxID=1122961 RepID=Q6L0G8_PICTO|nr:EF-Tu/IF-2/RF-3 family GTPase [Picrophilus oshimae]AAT43534.1 protein translation elongation factor [Picrophilus oshimae DSM 9789]
MSSINIFSYNSKDFIKDIAKSGTKSDIEIYHRKDNDIFTIIEPVRYPDKVSSLTDSIYPAQAAIINGDIIDKNLGEVLVALELMGKKRLFVISNENKNRISNLLKSTAFDYTLFDGRPMELLDHLRQLKYASENETYVLIDHFFKVRGVGTVALGFVLSGKIEKHQKLIISDLDREIEIRSIQMNDVDQDYAGPGSRVGLALKNIEPEEMSRGMILSDRPFEYKNEIDGDIIYHNAVKSRLNENSEVFVCTMMRYQRGIFKNKKIILEKRLPVIENFTVLSSNNIFPRVFARINF